MGRPLPVFSVATNRKFTTSDGESREETEWFKVSAWGRLAETCNQFLTKGQKIYVEGRLRSRSYETRDGQTRFENEIVATDVRFLDRAGSKGEEFGGEPDQPAGSGVEADDLPF